MVSQGIPTTTPRRGRPARFGAATDRAPGARQRRLFVGASLTPVMAIFSAFSILPIIAVIAYSFYTFSADNLPKNHVMMATIPFVMYGIFRYLYLVYKREEGGSPDELVTRDKPLLACVALWALTAGTLLAIFR